jgi:hypothetical protein
MSHIVDNKVYSGSYGYEVACRIENNKIYSGPYGYDIAYRIDGNKIYSGSYGYDVAYRIDRENQCFHLKHPLSMHNMYCILDLRRGITIPQIYMTKRAKMRFCAGILLKTGWICLKWNINLIICSTEPDKSEDSFLIEKMC